MLSDLRESGSLEQDADIVMFIHKKEGDLGETQRSQLIELMVSKHRNGPTKDIELVFLKDLAQFYNAKTID